MSVHSFLWLWIVCIYSSLCTLCACAVSVPVCDIRDSTSFFGLGPWHWVSGWTRADCVLIKMTDQEVLGSPCLSFLPLQGRSYSLQATSCSYMCVRFNTGPHAWTTRLLPVETSSHRPVLINISLGIGYIAACWSLGKLQRFSRYKQHGNRH